MGVVGDLMAARMRQFQHIVADELPALVDTIALGLGDPRGPAGATPGTCEDWLAGILNWHRGCHRYAEADLIAGACPALSARPALFRRQLALAPPPPASPAPPPA